MRHRETWIQEPFLYASLKEGMMFSISIMGTFDARKKKLVRHTVSNIFHVMDICIANNWMLQYVLDLRLSQRSLWWVRPSKVVKLCSSEKAWLLPSVSAGFLFGLLFNLKMEAIYYSSSEDYLTLLQFYCFIVVCRDTRIHTVFQINLKWNSFTFVPLRKL